MSEKECTMTFSIDADFLNLIKELESRIDFLEKEYVTIWNEIKRFREEYVENIKMIILRIQKLEEKE